MKLGGLEYHQPATRIPYHRHVEAHLDLVLSGGYTEAGENGRVHVSAGSLIFHQCHQGHRDVIGIRSCSVLSLPLPSCFRGGFAVVDDADHIVRIAERDPSAALAEILTRVRYEPSKEQDWPDMLAAALIADPSVELRVWADEHGMRASSVSRGFVQCYGVSPKRFRLEARTRKAIELIARGWSLAATAAEAGFCDQSHMHRALKAMTGCPTGGIMRAAH